MFLYVNAGNARFFGKKRRKDNADSFLRNPIAVKVPLNTFLYLPIPSQVTNGPGRISIILFC